MRISDWSSDVCSSDLCPKNIAVSFPLRHQSRNAQAQKKIATTSVNGCSPLSVGLVSRKKGIVSFAAEERQPRPQSTPRSEARRLGKARVSRCRSRWSAYPYKKKYKEN